jgi:predicted anti-sigma-YlaC factor YlaD
MPDQIRNKLGAYHDGQLDRRGQSEVEDHLKTCSACQAELEELRQLSHLLRAAPLPEFTPALDFKAQFMLQLPRRTETQPGREAQHTLPNGQLLPWLAPALVLASWIFFQLTLGLSSLVSLAVQAGFLHGAADWFSSGPQQMLWVATIQAALGGFLSPQGQTGLQILNDAGLFTQNLLIALLLQVGVAVVYWGVLALMWHNKVKALWISLSAR